MASETVTETPDRLTLSRPLQDWLEEAWENSGYPSGVRNRLLRIDQAAHSLSALTRLLAADRRSRLAVSECGCEYDPLPANTAEGLECARDFLADHLVGELEEMRDAISVYGQGVLKGAP